MTKFIFELEDIGIVIYVLKLICINIFSYYTALRIMDSKSKNISKYIKILFIAILCGIIKYLVNFFSSLMLMIMLTAIVLAKEIRDNIGNSILIVTISLSINYVIFLMATAISFIPIVVLGIKNVYASFVFIMIFYIVFLFLFFRIKRFKRGFIFLQKKKGNEYFNILVLLISTIILLTDIILANYNTTTIGNVVIGFTIFAIIMFITIQKSLQLYYKQKLLVQELNETKTELEKKTKEIEELEKENLSFSKKSHTLAHKQKSLEYKLQEILNKTEISKEEAGEVKDRLKEIEKDLYKEKTVIELDKTGISQIDDMLKYMQSECTKNKIDFELQINGNIHYMTNNLISKEDLETLLADHIKNAIIAINHTENINRSILVRLGKIDETYALYIYDSGIEFEKETLENLGKKPSTTHANEGGTGMGFMNTFDTLKKYKASLIIEEYNEPSKDNYTKAIMIKFDNKNQFEIISYRQNSVIKK